MTRRITQAEAVCTSFGWDIHDADEYQPGHTSGRYGSPPVKVFNAGDGFAIALKIGRAIPLGLVDSLGPWREHETIPAIGYTVFVAGNV